MLVFWVLLHAVRPCTAGSKPFACGALHQNDSPALKATGLLFALTAISFLHFSLPYCHRHTNLQNKRGMFLCQKPERTPFLRQQCVPVFQLEAAAVTALFLPSLTISSSHLKNPFLSCWTLMRSHLSQKWPRSVFYKSLMANCIGWCLSFLQQKLP